MDRHTGEFVKDEELSSSKVARRIYAR